MTTRTLNCPNCGAAVSSDASACQYCGARLATVSCPQCFGLAFVGSKFCPHCGAALTEAVSEGTSILPCPRCNQYMQQRALNQILLTECDKCGGLWIDAETFHRICADRENQSAVLGSVLGPDAQVTIEKSPRYLACPRCGQLMNRLNFAHHSGVIIDICKPHGIWFDRDELRRIIEFILAGGIDRAREQERAEVEEARRDRESAVRAALSGGMDAASLSRHADKEYRLALRFVGGLLGHL